MNSLYLRSLVFSAFVLFLVSFSGEVSAANWHVSIDEPKSPTVVEGKDVTFKWHYEKTVNVTKVVLYTSAGHRTVPPSAAQYTWVDFPYGYGWWYLKVYKDNSSTNWARTKPVQFHHQFPGNWVPADPKKDIHYTIKYLSDGRIEFLELQTDYRVYLPGYFIDRGKLPYGDRWRKAKMFSQATSLPRKSWDFIELYAGGLLRIKKGYRWDSASFPCKKLGSGSCIDDDANIRSSLVHDALYDLMRLYLLNPAKSGYRPAGRFNRMMADMMHYMIAIEDGQYNKDFFTYWPLRGNGALGDYYTLQDLGMGATHDDGRLNDWKFHVSDLRATVSGTDVTLTWKPRDHSTCTRRTNSKCEPASHAALTPPLEYDVVRYDQAVPSQDQRTVLNDTNKVFSSTSYSDTTGAPGSTYWYRIERVPSGGDHYDDYSNVVKVTLAEANKTPLVDAGPGGTIDEGDTFSSSGSFADPGSSAWTATVDYGDGSGVQPLSLTGKTFTLSHNYVKNGLYSVTVTVTDEHSALGTGTALVLVEAVNVPPVVDAGSDGVVNEGGVLSSSGSFTDSDSTEWSAAVDYGDGSIDQPLTLTGKTFELSHIYADNGVYTVTVEVIDDDSGISTDTAQVTVTNAAPITSIDTVDRPNAHFILPVVHTLTFNGGFWDPGWLDTHEAAWDFGDGAVVAESLAEENASPDSTGSTTSEHAYAAPGIYTATLTIVDDDGDAGTDTVTVYVVTPQEAVAAMNNAIVDLPELAFGNHPDHRKSVLSHALLEVVRLLNAGANRDAADMLRRDIRSKADGVARNPWNDWIVDQGAKEELCAMVDDLIAYLALERPKRISDCNRLSPDPVKCEVVF